MQCSGHRSRSHVSLSYPYAYPCPPEVLYTAHTIVLSLCPVLTLTSLGMEALNVDAKLLALVKHVIEIILVQGWPKKRVSKHARCQWLWLRMTFGCKGLWRLCFPVIAVYKMNDLPEHC